jgi:cation-transporting ATPase E
MNNVMYKALPAGLTDFTVISLLDIFCKEFRVSGPDLSTSCTILLAIVGIMILYKIASPMTTFHWILWFAMFFGILFCMVFLNEIFAISMLSRKSAMLLIIFAIITEPILRYMSLLLGLLWKFAGWLRDRVREERDKAMQI